MTAPAIRRTKPQPNEPTPNERSTPRARYSSKQDVLASWRVWIASALLFFPFAFVFFASSAPFSIPEAEAACGQAPPDMRFYTSGDGVVEFLDACGSAGRDSYQNMQIADLFYPAIIAIFLTSSLAIAVRRLAPAAKIFQWVPAIPLLAAAFDYVENTFAWLAIASYPDTIATNQLLGLASATKTSLSWIGGVALLACLVALGARAAKRFALRPALEQNEHASTSIQGSVPNVGSST